MMINKGNWTGEGAVVEYGRMDATHIQMKAEGIGEYIIRIEGSSCNYEDDTVNTYNFWVRPVQIKETVVCGFVTVYIYNHNIPRTSFIAWEHPCMTVERELDNEGINRVEGIVEVVASVLYNIV